MSTILCYIVIKTSVIYLKNTTKGIALEAIYYSDLHYSEISLYISYAIYKMGICKKNHAIFDKRQKLIIYDRYLE